MSFYLKSETLDAVSAANDTSQTNESSPKQRERARLGHGNRYFSSIIPAVVIAALRMLAVSRAGSRNPIVRLPFDPRSTLPKRAA
jgi:hypothetical protein